MEVTEAIKEIREELKDVNPDDIFHQGSLSVLERLEEKLNVTK